MFLSRADLDKLGAEVNVAYAKQNARIEALEEAVKLLQAKTPKPATKKAA